MNNFMYKIFSFRSLGSLRLGNLLKRAKYLSFTKVTGCFSYKIIDIASHHHEKLDGTGYPDGLRERDLSVGDKIIAIDTYSGMSPFAGALNDDLPKFDMMTPDCEAIIALNPDIIFTTGMSSAHGEDVYASVKAAGVCVADIPTAASIQDIEDDITFLGDVTGTSDKAKEINDRPHNCWGNRVNRLFELVQ